MAVMVEQRSYRPFKSSEEYLYAMKEDLAEWLNNLYADLYINVNNFMDRLDTGVALCEHANNVRKYAEEYVSRRQAAGKTNVHSIATSALRLPPIRSFPGAKPGTFFARDNVSNFIAWCRHGLGVFECLLFETDDLILRKNEKHVILCLLEVARRAAKLGMPAPMLVHLEREIDREIAAEKRKLRFGGCQDYYEEGSDEESDLSDGDDCVEYGPIPQIVTNDLKSLDEMVRDEVEKCQCPTQFPMIRVSEGKYRIGDTKVLIFVRILRSHVMVRVGGGWDTLSHYLDKHDPCRCRTSHRAAVSSRISGIKSGGPALEISHAQVHYDRSPPRTRRSSTSSNSSNGGSTFIPTPTAATLKSNVNRSTTNLSPNPNNSERRSRSPTPRLKKLQTLAPEPRRTTRSRSPTPNPCDRVRSRSGTPTSHKRRTEKKDRSIVASNKDLTLHLNDDGIAICRSRSPSVGRAASRHNSTSSNGDLSTERDVQAVNGVEPAIKADSLTNDNDDNDDELIRQFEELQQQQHHHHHHHHRQHQHHHHHLHSNEETKNGVEVGGVAGVAGGFSPLQRVGDNIKGACQHYHVNSIAAIDDADAAAAAAPAAGQHAPEVAARDGRIDTTPACRVSDNFVGTSQYHLLYTSPPKEMLRRSVSPCRERSGVDTTPSCKISENFARPPYQTATTTMPVVVQKPATLVAAERGGVDTTPVSKVSENFVSSGGSGGGGCGTPRSRKSSASVNDLDLITKKEPNDSGSEVSDEGYKSLGLVTTPPANAHQTAVPPLPGSPSRAVRPPRSRSAGGQDSPSPQQSPFRRNAKANQSARQSPTHHYGVAHSPNGALAAKHSPRSARNCNTWNSSVGKKKRPVITEDTFCQQVAEIMQQYAAMMPSPRKDSKPDSRITTRIPAPVPVHRT